MPFFNLYSHLMHPVKSFANSNPFWKSLRTMKGLLTAWFNRHNFAPVLMQTTPKERDLLKLHTTWFSLKSKKSISYEVQFVSKTLRDRKSLLLSKSSSKSIRWKSKYKESSPTIRTLLNERHSRSFLPRNRIWVLVNSTSLFLLAKVLKKFKIVKQIYELL